MGLIRGLSNVIAIVLSVGFLGAGMIKLVGVEDVSNAFAVWGYPSWSIYVIGIVELLLFIGFFISKTRLLSCILSFALMSGAIYTHYVHYEYDQLYGPLVVLVLSLSLLILLIFDKRVDEN